MVLLLMSFATVAHAEEKKLSLEDVVASYPPEMLYNGKPIDPKCVYASIEDHKDKGVNLKEGCSEFLGDGFSDEKQTLVIGAKRTGYDFEYEGGESGEFYYEVVGKIPEGTVLKVNYSTGGSGYFSDLGVYKRDEDILRKVRTLAGGDRCSGGIREAKIDDGRLLYAYEVTPLELYQHYIPDASYRGDLGSAFTSCGAVIYMRGDVVERVELTEGADFSECFKEGYMKQIESKKILSDSEAKDFIQKFSKMCPVTE